MSPEESRNISRIRDNLDQVKQRGQQTDSTRERQRYFSVGWFMMLYFYKYGTVNT